MTQRFDVNNKELNQKKFAEQTQHLLSRKNKAGAKFGQKTIDFTLTPPEHE